MKWSFGQSVVLVTMRDPNPYKAVIGCSRDNSYSLIVRLFAHKKWFTNTVPSLSTIDIF